MWGECLLGAHKAEDIHIMYSMWRSCSSRTPPTRRDTIRFEECQQETTLRIGNGEAMTTTELLHQITESAHPDNETGRIEGE